MIKNRWHIGLSLLSHSPFSAHIAQRSRCFYNRHPNWFAASITRTGDRFLSFGGEDCQEESSVQTLFVIIHCPFACDCFGRPPLSRSALFIVATSSNPITNRILTQTRSAFNLREVMDEGKKILLVNLAKGKIGEDAASLLGALLVTKIGLAGLSRADMAAENRRDFYLYIDEFQNFATLSLANMLSELRKYRINMILSHQFQGQLDPQVRDAILAKQELLFHSGSGSQTPKCWPVSSTRSFPR